MTSVDDLNLSEPAATAARKLAQLHPEAVFTSGRRTVLGQAMAMASNAAHNRRWIVQTYRAPSESAELQAWVDAHPEAASVEALARGLEGVMNAWPHERLARLSKHFSGDAFDVRPVGGDVGEAIKRTIRALPGLVKFLDYEGGLVRWHAEFA